LINNYATVFRMPFPAGAVALLQQGNFGRADMSHAEVNCLHALDFTGFEHKIVASADGIVSYVFADALPGDANAGYGFGNFVKVEHACDCYSFYAHLVQVKVSPGQAVLSGQVIGIMGNTGWAGEKIWSRPTLN
jgi:murein DD-endopeptidase MepM/ murein hydrolase activator NlpD